MKLEGCRRRSLQGRFPLGGAIALLVGLFPLEYASAQSTQETVNVRISVGQIAEIEFPEGSGFELDIPDREDGRGPRGPFGSSLAPQLDAARIPFVLRANHTVRITAIPLQVVGWRGNVAIGGATQVDDGEGVDGRVLPYTLQLELQDHGSSAQVRGLGITSGQSTRFQNEITVRESGQGLRGIIHVHPDISWADVASGRYTASGVFSGEVRLGVVPDAD